MKKGIKFLALLTILAASQTNILTIFVPKKPQLTIERRKKIMEAETSRFDGYVIETTSGNEPFTVKAKLRDKLAKGDYLELYPCWVFTQEELSAADIKKKDHVIVEKIKGENDYWITEKFKSKKPIRKGIWQGAKMVQKGMLTKEEYYAQARSFNGIVTKKYTTGENKNRFEVRIRFGRKLICYIAPKEYLSINKNLKFEDINEGDRVEVKISPNDSTQGRIYGRIYAKRTPYMQPTVKPAEPIFEPVKPVFEPVKPVVEPVKPVVEPTKPMTKYANKNQIPNIDGTYYVQVRSGLQEWKVIKGQKHYIRTIKK